MLTFPEYPQWPVQGLVALQELCLPPSGADDAPGRILTHKHFQASSQPWECGNVGMRGLQKAEFLP